MPIKLIFTYSFMGNINRYLFIFSLFAVLILTGCSKSDDQKEFEDNTFSSPENYTAMQASGLPSGTNQTDPDDWRISPMYQGLVEVETPAYPNPVVLNEHFELDVNITGIESVSEMVIYVFKDVGENLYGPIGPQFDESSLLPGIKRVRINTSTFSGTGYTTGLFRIVIMDGRDNVITYGDIFVE